MKSLSPKVEQVLLYDMRSVTQLPGMEEGGAYASWLYGYNGSRWSSRLCWRGPEGQSVYCPQQRLPCPNAWTSTPRVSKSNDRAAGTAANQRAAAATAWILANSASGFVNGPMSWTGDTCLNSFFFQIENYIFWCHSQERYGVFRLNSSDLKSWYLRQ